MSWLVIALLAPVTPLASALAYAWILRSGRGVHDEALAVRLDHHAPNAARIGPLGAELDRSVC